MAVYTKIAEFAASGSNVLTTGNRALLEDVAAGTLIVMIGSTSLTASVYTPGSSAGMTWTPVVTPWPESTAGTSGRTLMWTAIAPSDLDSSDWLSLAQNVNTLLGMVAFAVTEIDMTTGIVDVSSGANSGSSTSLSLPPLDTVDGGSVLFGASGGSSTSQPMVSITPSTILHAANPTGATSNRLLDASAADTTAGTVTPSVVSTIATRRQGIAISFAPADAPPPEPGTVLSMWTGAPTHESVVVHARTSGATSCRLAVSTSPSMTSPTYTSAEVPDAYGFVRFTPTSLDDDTEQYFQVADTPSGGSETLIGPVGSIRTLGTPGVAVAFRKVSVGGCLRTNSTITVALQNAMDWAPHWGHFNGDFFYNANNETNEAVWVGKYNSQIANVGADLQAFIASGLAAYELVSDHDTTNVDNGDSDEPWAPYELAAWRKVVPHLAGSGDSTCRDQQWDDGRISYFMTDVRSVNRSPGTDADGPSKTMLGAAQEARLMDWLENNPAPFKVIITDSPWMGPAETVLKPDAWWSYAYNRGVIASAINVQQALGFHVEVWHGDSHLIGYALPEDNAYGGFPVICSAPWDNDGGGRNSSQFTEFFNNGGDDAAEYTRITFEDDGTTITRTADFVDALTDTIVFSYVTEVTPTPPAGGFSGTYTWGPATSGGERPSEGDFAGTYGYGPAAASGSRLSEGNFAGAYSFGPAAAGGSTSAEGGFAGAYGFGPAAASGERDSEGSFSSSYAFGPAGFAGSAGAEGGFSGAYGFGPAAADGSIDTEGEFAGTYGWGPATAGGGGSASGGFTSAYQFGPASADGERDSAGAFAAAYGFGPAAASGERPSEGDFAGQITWGPATAGGAEEVPSGGFTGSYTYGPASASGGGDDFCWPNPMGLAPLGPQTSLVPLYAGITLIPMGPVYGLAVEDPC